IALAATIPAVLYFAGIFIAVHLESKRVGILGLPADQIPRLKEVMLQRGYLLLPLLAIIGVLVMGQSPITAALIAILVAVTVGLFEGGSLKQTLVERWYLLLPLLGLLYLVFSKASLPATWGALGLLFVAFLIHQFRHSQFTFKDLIVVLEEGTRTALGVIAACGAAGIIVGVVTLTGLGLKVAGGIIELAGGILILTMF